MCDAMPQDLLTDAAAVDALYLSIIDRAQAEPFRCCMECRSVLLVRSGPFVAVMIVS